MTSFKNIALLLISITLTLLVLEGLIRVLDNLKSKSLSKDYSKIYSDERNISSYVFGHKENVSILIIKRKHKNFHARFSAKMRIYNYIIINRLSAPVLDNNRGWHIIKKLDLEIMKKGAKKLVGRKDFSTFRASSCRAKSSVKTMKMVKIKSLKDKIEIEFRSQSFLQQQVRSMVGCLKYLGEKKWSLKKFESVMRSKNRILCAPPAPPEGLYLARIIY